LSRAALKTFTADGHKRTTIVPPNAQLILIRIFARMSPVGPSRHFAGTQQFGRFGSEADIPRAAIAEPDLRVRALKSSNFCFDGLPGLGAQRRPGNDAEVCGNFYSSRPLTSPRLQLPDNAPHHHAIFPGIDCVDTPITRT
jgi:hypothetical protein